MQFSTRIDYFTSRGSVVQQDMCNNLGWRVSSPLWRSLIGLDRKWIALSPLFYDHVHIGEAGRTAHAHNKIIMMCTI